MELKSLTNEEVESSKESALLDFQGEGEMLAVCFGFYKPDGDSEFDFFKRLKKLEKISGRKINKLLLRDFNKRWFLDDTGAVLGTIRDAIRDTKAPKIVAIGQSMGGYAAILYGALANIDKVISFGPLSLLDSARLELMRDHRWLGVIKAMEASPPQPFYNDLPSMLRELKPRTEIEIFYGTSPGDSADRNEAVNYDAAHAIGFYGIDRVRLFPLHNSPHAVVEYMRNNKIIDSVLLNRLFDLPVQEFAVPGISPEWWKWLQENIALGCLDGQLVETLVANGFTTDNAKTALAAAHAYIAMVRIVSD